MLHHATVLTLRRVGLGYGGGPLGQGRWGALTELDLVLRHTLLLRMKSANMQRSMSSLLREARLGPSVLHFWRQAKTFLFQQAFGATLDLC